MKRTCALLPRRENSESARADHGQESKGKPAMNPKRFTVLSARRSSLSFLILFLAVGRTPAAVVPGEIIDWGVGLLPVPAPSTHYTAVAAADEDNLALKDDGTVVAWADPNAQDAPTLTNVAATLTGVTAIAAVQNVNMALFKNGTVKAWGGGNNEGMTNVPPGLTNVMAIALGAFHSLALQSNGTIVSWGGDYGDADGNTVLPPTNSLIKAIASGLTHGLALTSGGTVLPWGNLSANLSGGTIKPVDPSYLVNVKAIAAGDYHAMVLKNDGTVVAWGENDEGECNVPSNLTNVVAISAGDGHSVALKGRFGRGLGRQYIWCYQYCGYYQCRCDFGRVPAHAGAHWPAGGNRAVPTTVVKTGHRQKNHHHLAIVVFRLHASNDHQSG
jgi:hypothetical protein